MLHTKEIVSSPLLRRGFLLSALVFNLASCGWGQVTVVVDGNQTFQTISGWGGNTYSWIVHGWNGWTNQQIYNIAFHELGTTHVRMVAEFESWEPANDDDDPDHFNWNYYQSRFAGSDVASRLVQGDFKMMDKVVNEFHDRLLIGIWDLPNWMVADSTLTQKRKLPHRLYHEFAESVAAYLLWAREQRGILIREIVIANEPDGHNVEYSPHELRDLIKTVGAKFDREGIKTKIVGPDLSSPYFDPEVWIAPLLADSVAVSYLSAISYHTYYTSGTPDKWNLQFSRIAALAASKNLPVYFTEVGTTPHDIPNTTWAWAFSCIQMWHNALSHGGANLVFQWALLGRDNAINADTTRNPIFYALQQFFGHIPAGAVRLAVTSANADLLVSAFMHRERHRAQIVLINRSRSDQRIVFELRGFKVSTFAVCRTSATEKHRPTGHLGVSNSMLTLTVPADAIMTLDGAINVSLNAR